MSFEEYHTELAEHSKACLRTQLERFEWTNDEPLIRTLNIIIDPERRTEVTVPMLDTTREQLQHRFLIMHVADQYVASMGLLRPHEKKCRQFNKDDDSDFGNADIQLWDTIKERFYERHWKITSPDSDVGTSMNKGLHYLVSTIEFNIRTGNKTVGECFVLLEKLTAEINAHLELVKKVIKDVPEIREARQQLAEAYGKTIGELSAVWGHDGEQE